MPEEINQLATNLLQNGLEAVKPSQGIIQIDGCIEGSELVLKFRDNGSGIKPEDQGRIFTPFFTTKDVGEGLGMGLTIVRRCVVALGGTIAVRSKPAAGTEFTVRLPRDQKLRRPESPLSTGARETESRTVDHRA